MTKLFTLKILIFAILLMLFAKFIFISDGMAWLSSGLKPILYVLIIIYLINPIVNYFYTNTKLKRTGSVVVSFLICFVFLIGFIGMIMPSIIDSTRVVLNNIPQNNEQFLKLVKKMPFISSLIDTSSLSTFLDAIGSWIVSYSEDIMNYSGEVINSVRNFLGALSVGILSLLMAFYALKDNEHINQSIEEAIHAFVPDRISDEFLKVMHLLDAAFKKFLIGKLYTCFFLGVIVTLMIVIFNLIGPWGIYVPYAPLVGFIIGLTNIIPYVGPLIGTIPCLFLALLSGFGEAIVLLAIVLTAQQVDNILISPKILGDKVGLGPFWVVLSVTIGGALFGAIGMVLFVPLTSVLLKLAMERIEVYRAESEL